jgi:hypothetical protein
MGYWGSSRQTFVFYSHLMYLLQKPCPSSGHCCKQEFVTARLITCSPVKPGQCPSRAALVSASRCTWSGALRFRPLLPANQISEFRKGESHEHALDSSTFLLPSNARISNTKCASYWYPCGVCYKPLLTVSSNELLYSNLNLRFP